MRQTPFLTVLVFGIGVGLGVGWKLGWIPVEFGDAKTGALTQDVEPEDDPATVATDSGEPPADPEVFASQSEPTRSAPEELEPTPEAVPQRPLGEPNRSRSVRPAGGVVSAGHIDDEPEWAADTPVQPARQRVVAVPPRNLEEIGRANREIRLVGNQETAPRKTEEPPPASAEPSAATGLEGQLAEIDAQIASGEILPAHRALSKLYWNHKELRRELMPRLEETARVVFFEPQPNFVEPYVVQANDQMRVIANKYQLSWEYLSKLNRTEPKRLQPGQKLKVLKGPFAAVVDLNDFALTVHLQGYYVRRYTVGIGKDGASPIGKFSVLNKVENPQYTGPDGKVISADDPTNPLGERWIDLGDSYGIHGTIEPDSIGKAASRGCIRMGNKEVIQVYDFLVKGSEVVIRK